MRVGIYNRWLTTMGGAEQYTSLIAQLLSQRHQVELITHKTLDKAQFEKRLAVDLSQVSIRYVPFEPEDGPLQKVTAEYDFFINSTYYSCLPSQAKRSLLVVYFPYFPLFSAWERVRRKIGFFLKSQFKLAEYASGFHGFVGVNRRLFQLMSSEAVIRIPANGKSTPLMIDIELILPDKPRLIPPITLACQVDGKTIKRFELSTQVQSAGCSLELPATNYPYQELVLSAEKLQPVINEESKEPMLIGPGVIVNKRGFRHDLYQFIFVRQFRHLGNRLFTMPVEVNLEQLDSYDKILSISKYVQFWVKEKWQRESEILYPPVNVNDFKPLEKQNMILSVGRFFASDHSKKQMVLVEAFKTMVEQGLSNWELHLAGGSSPWPQDQRYLQQVQEAAKGYPIYFHIDTAFSNLVKLYGQSKLYWHASGYGERVERNPVAFEHFGITAVEAMAAGAVPVVIGKAGLMETVRHEIDGFLWETLPELQSYSWRLISDEALRQKMSRTAQEQSQLFSREAFMTRLTSLLADMGMAI
jgi:glycosyltransferase involved in cell wall biosynthesis